MLAFCSSRFFHQIINNFLIFFVCIVLIKAVSRTIGISKLWSNTALIFKFIKFFLYPTTYFINGFAYSRISSITNA